MNNNPHQNAIKQLEQVAQLLVDQYPDKKRFQAAVEKLKTPDKVLEGELIVEMDDGTQKKYTAYRSQHNNARGPYKGGIRFHKDVSKEEVMALSTWMTWKCAVTGIPYGGGKGGIIVDPQTLSEAELQRLSRAYARFVAQDVGPWTDIPAPDVNTTGQIMAWMVDEWEVTKRQQKNESVQTNPLATFTGKPLELGGSQGREEATGLGGVYMLEELTKVLHKKPQEITIAIQGFGNVGYWFAVHAYNRGYRVVAISDSKGAIYNEAGLKPQDRLAHKQKNKTLLMDGDTQLTNEELLELDVDVLVPAALENVIHQGNATNIKARTVIEMANGPITPEADVILEKNKVEIIPDVLANAGGVTTSYFEWVQNLQGYSWTKDEVLAKLQPLMVDAFQTMWQMKQSTKLNGRMATYVTAVKRVIDAMLLRGRV